MREGIAPAGLSLFFDDDEIGLQAAEFGQAEEVDGEEGAGWPSADDHDRILIFELHG
jgi:hypothetical protein